MAIFLEYEMTADPKLNCVNIEYFRAIQVLQKQRRNIQLQDISVTSGNLT